MEALEEVGGRELEADFESREALDAERCSPTSKCLFVMVHDPPLTLAMRIAKPKSDT